MNAVEYAMLSALSLMVSATFSFVTVAWMYSVFFDEEEDETWLE